jgi:phosphopantothenoylcysteine decarboxylase/phosphopantothenate--cysteine ligase
VKKTAARVSPDSTPRPTSSPNSPQEGRLPLIGFAAETQSLQQEARRKLETKNCDMVVGNLVGATNW